MTGVRYLTQERTEMDAIRTDGSRRSTKYATRDDVAAKVQWEGSLTDALEYGVSYDEMPDDELGGAWVATERAYSEFSKAAEIVEDILNGDANETR
jgi:hypothetical protein